MARAVKLARLTRGSPTGKVNKHGFPTLQTLFSSKLCGRVIFLKCLPMGKKTENSSEFISHCCEQLIRFKQPPIEGHSRPWNRGNKQKSPKGDSLICRASEEDTPPNFAPFCEELEVELWTKFQRFLRSGEHYISSSGTRMRAGRTR